MSDDKNFYRVTPAQMARWKALSTCKGDVRATLSEIGFFSTVILWEAIAFKIALIERMRARCPTRQINVIRQHLGERPVN